MAPTSRALVVMVATMLACSGGSSAGDSSGTTESSTTDLTVPTGTSESTGTPVCEDPSDVGIGPAVSVHLQNDGAQDVFISAPNSCDGDPYRLHYADDSIVQTALIACPPPCADVLANHACGCPDAVCATEIVRI